MPINNLKAINDYSETILAACGKAFLEKTKLRTHPNPGDIFYAEIGRYFFAKLKGESYKLDAKLIEIYTEIDPLWNQTDSFRYIKCKEQESQRAYSSISWERNRIFVFSNNLAMSIKKITERLDATFDHLYTQQAQARPDLQSVQAILWQAIKQLGDSIDYNSMLSPTSGNKANLEALAEQINFLDIAIKFEHSGATLPDNITIELLHPNFSEYPMPDAIVNALTTGKLLLDTFYEREMIRDLDRLYFILQYWACQTEQAIQACNAELFYIIFTIPQQSLIESHRKQLNTNQQELSSYRIELLSAFEIFCKKSMKNKLFDNNISLLSKLEKTRTIIENHLDALSESIIYLRRLKKQIINLDAATKKSFSNINKTYKDQLEQFSDHRKQCLYLQELAASAAPEDLSALQQDILFNNSQAIINLNKAFDSAADSVKACCTDIDTVIKTDKADFAKINNFLRMPVLEIPNDNLRKVILLLEEKIIGYKKRMDELLFRQKEQQAIFDEIGKCSLNLSQTKNAQPNLPLTLCLFLLANYRGSIKSISNNIARLQHCHTSALSLQTALSQRIESFNCSETMAPPPLKKQDDEAPTRRCSR